MPAPMRIFWRGFIIVVMTAMNVYQIAHAHYSGAFVIGTGISVAWWTNARSSSRADVKFGALWYGLGAGCGTVCGMALMRLVYG